MPLIIYDGSSESGKLSETKLTAMWEASGVNLSQEQIIAQFEKKVFATRKKVRMLSDGHTPIHASSEKSMHTKRVRRRKY